MEFTEFVAMMSSSAKDQDIEDDLREAFRVFDKEGKRVQKLLWTGAGKQKITF